MDWGNLNEIINENRKKVNERMIKEKGSLRKKRSRSRSEGEKKALDQIAIAKWRKREEAGKIRRIGPNKIYYDYRD